LLVVAAAVLVMVWVAVVVLEDYVQQLMQQVAGEH
jgi:hypothetical protein